MTVGMVTDSRRMGRRRCPSKGAVLVRTGDMVAGEAVANGMSSEGYNWRRAITST